MPTNAVKPFDGNREYSGGQYKASPKFTMRQGDPRVHDLFVEFTNHPKQAVTWDFQSRVVNIAQELFEGEYNWFMKQDSNSALKDQNYAFILDTVRYIVIGKRRFSIHTWPTLVSFDIPAVNDTVKDRRDVFKLIEELKFPLNTNAFIQRWLSHKDGFNDLMYTLHLLFGNIPEKIEK